ncbi:MAG: flagellar hook basal-body protein [Planctomycetes bacterium]|nr:flagellar hook basal-body protein [Planctomycetota bacterium]
MSDMITQIGSKLTDLATEFNVVAHNLSNSNTIGFKRRVNSFARSLAVQGVGMQAANGDEINLRTTYDFTQGNMRITGRSLDFALHGKGFFMLETPEGPLYTRNGAFALDENGQIVDSSGRIVAGESGAISVPNTISILDLKVGTDGNILANGAAIGKFKLVDFKENEEDLMAVGASCFKAPEGVVGEEAEKLIVKQGFQEQSNVKLVEELVDMIMVSRLYEANMKFIAVKRDVSKSLMSVANS